MTDDDFLTEDEYRRRLHRLAEQLPPQRLKTLLSMIERHQRGEVIGEWLGKKWVFLVALLGGFVAAAAVPEKIAALASLFGGGR